MRNILTTDLTNVSKKNSKSQVKILLKSCFENAVESYQYATIYQFLDYLTNTITKILTNSLAQFVLLTVVLRHNILTSVFAHELRILF